MKLRTLAIFGCALLVTVSSFAAPKTRPATVKGCVTEPDGTPIAGVVVSDSYHVVVTDADGRYEFPRIDPAFYVWVSIPSSHEVPVRGGQPAFYRKLSDAASYDFVLQPLKKQEKNFTIFFMADPQCQKLLDVRRLAEEGVKDLKASAKKQGGPCYGMTLGDIGYSEGFRNTNYILTLMRDELSAEKTGMPVFQTVGNHDFEYDLTSVEASSPTITLRRNRIYENVFGPVDYSVNRGDVHMVSMNDVCFETFGYPGKYHCEFTPEQIEWLRKDLAQVSKDKLVIFCVHIPLEGLEKKNESVRQVMDLLGEFPNVRIMSGHTHTIKHLTHPNGVKEFVAGAMSGCWWWSKNCADGTPNGYVVTSISGNRIVDELYKGQNFKANYQMRIYRGTGVYGGPYETFEMSHGENVLLVNVWNWDEGWRSEVYENGKLCGELERMPISSEMVAPYNGSKDWWAVGYNVGVVGRGHINGSTRNNYCSKNYHMLKYTMKDPAAKVKVVVYDPYGRKFTETKITTADDYLLLAAPPAYDPSPLW